MDPQAGQLEVEATAGRPLVHGPGGGRGGEGESPPPPTTTRRFALGIDSYQ